MANTVYRVLYFKDSLLHVNRTFVLFVNPLLIAKIKYEKHVVRFCIVAWALTFFSLDV